jgi:cytochrome P450
MHNDLLQTSMTLSATVFYLIHNKSVLSKLQNQVRGTFATFEEIRSGSKLNSLQLLRACIDETLRMAPPVPSHLPREILSGGMIIDGHHLPAGTVVGVAPWSIHHNPEYFPDPFRYHPNRWLVEETPTSTSAQEKRDSVAHAKSASCAFSLGSRGCIGVRLAYLEISLALCALLWVYDISEAEEEGKSDQRRRQKSMGQRHEDIRGMEGMYQLWDHFVADRIGPTAQLQRRGGIDCL